MSTLATPTAPADPAEVSSAVLLLAVVQRVERLSPTFVRITFGGNGFENLGPAGHPLDQRLKLVFPLNGRPLDISRVRPQHWRTDWLALPEHERGLARTYTARRIVGTGTERQVVIDFVLPGVGDGEDGHTADAIGPASEWASKAQPGDTVALLGPHIDRAEEYGGIEFRPGRASRVVMAADESALPALASILETLQAEPDGIREGVAIIEVGDPRDVVSLAAPDGLEVQWVVRTGPRGEATEQRLRQWWDLQCAADESAPLSSEEEADEKVWETAVHSSSGTGAVEAAYDRVPTPQAEDTYAWIASDSATVKRIRRILVNELDLPRSQVAFMGYWREVASR